MSRSKSWLWRSFVVVLVIFIILSLRLPGRQRDDEKERIFDRGDDERKDGDGGVAGSSNDGVDSSNSLRVFEDVKDRHVYLLHPGLQKAVDDADRGGPRGELTMWFSVLSGLKRLGVSPIVHTGSAAALARNASSNDGEDAIAFVDSGIFEDMISSELFPKCRFRLLDFWGTPQERNWKGLNLLQYLTPYPTPGFDENVNDFLGFIVQPNRFVSKTIEPSGVVWGKEGKYFKPSLVPSLFAISEIASLKTTVHASRQGGGAFRDVDRLNRVTNVGVLDQEGWQRLLGESWFVVGLGDPLLGPTAVQALAAGCAFINPVFDPPITIWNTGTGKHYSQHDYLAWSVGEPYVYSVRIDDPSSVVHAVQKIIERGPLKPLIPDPFRESTFIESLHSTLVNERICREPGTPARS